MAQSSSLRWKPSVAAGSSASKPTASPSACSGGHTTVEGSIPSARQTEVRSSSFCRVSIFFPSPSYFACLDMGMARLGNKPNHSPLAAQSAKLSDVRI